MLVNFTVSTTAQAHIKLAIKWLRKTSLNETARDEIKGLIGDFKNQLTLMPESGKICEYINLDEYRELIKGQYRFIYKLEPTAKGFDITIITFCHTRMHFQTLLAQTPEFIDDRK